MTTRGIRRKKSYLAEIKVAVIGAPCVGKSALTVRFLTKRYIGEYDHQAENRHKYEIMVDGEAVLCEIWDTCPKVKSKLAYILYNGAAQMENGTKIDGEQEIATPVGLSGVPSNEQLVQGLMGTIITLSSTLYQAIAGDDGGPEVLLQSLVPIRERLERVLQQLESQEAKVHAASVRSNRTPMTTRSQMPPTSRNEPSHANCETFAPPSSSTERETRLNADASFKSVTNLAATGDPSFVPPPGWREITNLESYMTETSGEANEYTELTDGTLVDGSYQGTNRTQTIDRNEGRPDSERCFDPTLAQSSPLVQEGARTKKSGRTFTLPNPKRTVDELFKGPNLAGTFAIRETSNYALADGSFQRSTKTIAGPDASVLAKCSKPLLIQDPMGIEENAEALSLTAGSETVQWADGLLLVYSITDRDSFNFIRKAKEELAGDMPVALVGNKVDMVHLRQVSTDEGEILAKDFECKFFEISAAEHVYQVAEAFLELCREVLTGKRKSKQSFIDKIDRMLSGSRTYNRGKSDSISPKD
uniref:small monomeric GTPase n=1 Tax=Anopheles minimus TaxID=112268 RepID=A0A182WKJ0_9DIPT